MQKQFNREMIVFAINCAGTIMQPQPTPRTLYKNELNKWAINLDKNLTTIRFPEENIAEKSL